MSEWQSVGDVLAGKHTGDTVRLRGWVHRQRSGGKIAFVTIRDGTGSVQCTVKGGIADDESLEAAKDALIESSVSLLEGEVAEDERAPGGYEVKVTKFVVHKRADDFPLRGEQGTDFELDNRHLWLRSTQLSTILRIKSRLLLAIREFYAAEGFVEVDPSVITTNACEGGSTLFTFDYFGKEAYLSQSAQMYLEGCIFGLPKVYSITNSFRAEKSRTNKHLTEFHHLEAEYAWLDNDANMAFQERMVEYLAHDIAKHCAEDLKVLGQDPDRLLAVKAPFERISYDDAVKELQELGFEFSHGEDFGAPHEKALTEGKTNPIFVTDWPAEIKAFYMHQDPDNKELVKCSDLLGPDGFGELIGGSQRSENIKWMRKGLLRQLEREIIEDRPKLESIAGLEFDESKLSNLDREILAETLKEIVQRVTIPTEGEIQQWMKHQDQAFTIEAAKKLRNLYDKVLGQPELVREMVQDSEGREAAARGINGLAIFSWVPYDWYFDLRRYGSVPHSGFGLGIERLLRWFTGQEHIRDMLPYPRTPSRAYP